MTFLLNPYRFAGGPTTLVVSPDANPETTTVDGYTRRPGVSGEISWASLLAASATQHYDADSTNYICYIQTGATTNTWVGIARGHLLFDTSSIPSGATINSATLELYCNNLYTTLYSGFDMYVVSTNPASNDDLVNGDHTTVGSTVFGTFNESSLSVGSSFSVSLSASAITKAGITKLGIRMADETDNTPPTWAASKIAGLAIRYAEYGGSTIPKLTVVYE